MTAELATHTPTSGKAAGWRRRLTTAALATNSRFLRRVVVAAVLAVGSLLLTVTPAHADATRDALYGMGATVGGSTSPAYYSPAQFYPQTTCTGSTNRVVTTILASPRNRSGGQWFYTRVWARDVTGGYGAWKNYGTAQAFIPEVNTMAYSMSDYRELATSAFSGYDGHSYQIYVEAWAANIGGQYQDLGAKYSNHYSSGGAYEPNIYGNILQRIPGAASTFCTVY